MGPVGCLYERMGLLQDLGMGWVTWGRIQGSRAFFWVEELQKAEISWQHDIFTSELRRIKES